MAKTPSSSNQFVPARCAVQTARWARQNTARRNRLPGNWGERVFRRVGHSMTPPCTLARAAHMRQTMSRTAERTIFCAKESLHGAHTRHRTNRSGTPRHPAGHQRCGKQQATAHLFRQRRRGGYLTTSGSAEGEPTIRCRDNCHEHVPTHRAGDRPSRHAGPALCTLIIEDLVCQIGIRREGTPLFRVLRRATTAFPVMSTVVPKPPMPIVAEAPSRLAMSRSSSGTPTSISRRSADRSRPAKSG